MRKLKGVLIDAKNREVKVVEFEDELERFYDLIDCRGIACASRKIGKKYYDIVCDDEGALVSNPIVSAYSHDGSPMLCGNLIILNGPDGKGNWRSIDEKDYDNIQRHVGMAESRNDVRPVLLCEY